MLAPLEVIFSCCNQMMHEKKIFKLVSVGSEKQVSEERKKWKTNVWIDKWQCIYLYCLLVPLEVIYFPITNRRCAIESYSCWLKSVFKKNSLKYEKMRTTLWKLDLDKNMKNNFFNGVRKKGENTVIFRLILQLQR